MHLNDIQLTLKGNQGFKINEQSIVTQNSSNETFIEFLSNFINNWINFESLRDLKIESHIIYRSMALYTLDTYLSVFCRLEVFLTHIYRFFRFCRKGLSYG